MDLSSILATGGMSGGVVAVAYLVYLFCKSRRSKCTSNCSSDEAAAASSPRAAPIPTLTAISPSTISKPIITTI